MNRLEPPDSAPPTNGMALASFVVGVASILLFFIGGAFSLFSLGTAAVVLGHVGRRQIRRRPGERGADIALVGLILSYLNLVGFVLFAVFTALWCGDGWPLRC
jgi:hypothetical protein